MEGKLKDLKVGLKLVQYHLLLKEGEHIVILWCAFYSLKHCCLCKFLPPVLIFTTSCPDCSCTIHS